jgi:hypothetical protein
MSLHVLILMIHILAAVYLKRVVHMFLHDSSVNAVSKNSMIERPLELRKDITRELSLNIPYKQAWQATEFIVALKCNYHWLSPEDGWQGSCKWLYR